MDKMFNKDEEIGCLRFLNLISATINKNSSAISKTGEVRAIFICNMNNL